MPTWKENFELARRCFRENMLLLQNSNTQEERAAYELNRGLLAFVDAVEGALHDIRSQVKRDSRKS